MRDSKVTLNEDIISCERCPRLREYCQEVAREKRKSFRDDIYWGRPVPNFGPSSPVGILIVGLAPAAHGANRTSRMFTGDRSGQWLYRALHRAGLANQSTYERADDGLKLIDCEITALAHCAPPDNLPTKDEMENCSTYLDRTFALNKPRVVIALGQLAWKAVLQHVARESANVSKPNKFSHGAEQSLSPTQIMIGSYHPSQQNTFTGRLTEPMFDAIFARAKVLSATTGKFV